MTRKGHLPPRVYLSHGRYYLVTLPDRKWVPLTKEREGLPALYRAYAGMVDKDSKRDLMPQVINRWLESKRSDWSEGTAQDQERIATQIALAFADFSPAQVTTPVCAEYLHRLRETPRTLNMHRSILRQVMAYAAIEGLREGHNPLDNIPQARLEARKRIVTDAEVQALKDAALQGRYGAGLVQMIDLALLTGQRIGDLIALRWQDVADDGISIVQSKTGERLLIEWSPALRAVIAACAHGRERIGHVLRTETGNPYRYSGIRSAWVRASDRAKISDLHIHDLRGRAGVDALGQDEDIRAAQRLLGHAAEGMTRHYVGGKYSRRTKPSR